MTEVTCYRMRFIVKCQTITEIKDTIAPFFDEMTLRSRLRETT